MKISLNWLRNYVNFNTAAADLADKLIHLGIEVESIEDQSKLYDNFVIGYVEECAKHPNADKLSLCKVNVGEDSLLNIVCGAPNVAKGQKVCVALIGAVIPNGNFEIKKTKIRGEFSEGMICSSKELNLGDDHTGIMVLDTNLPIGASFAEYLNKNDIIFDIGITPNRGDLLSHYGLAREISAIYNIKKKLPDLTINFSGTEINEKISVEIQNKNCLRYCGAMVENVQIQESPDWLKNYISACGLRPINNIVDITNFVMLECGQPLHAFDYEKIEGKKIIVKSAENFSSFTTLDNKQRKLRDDILLICDSYKPLALAGIMGGENSEISGNTNTVFIESAYFDPVLTRKSSKFLGLQTDSSYRFERGIDIGLTDWACKRAASLIIEIAGGKLVNGFIDNYPIKLNNLVVKLNLNQLNKISANNYTPEYIKNLLEKIDIICIEETENILKFEIPNARRLDLTREIDLIEEIIRLDGYEKIDSPDHSSLYFDTREFSEQHYNFLENIKSFIIGRGFKEVISNSLVDKVFQEKFTNNFAELLNPSSDKMNVLRTDLDIGLFDVIKLNIENFNYSLKLFEIGSSFQYADDNKINEFESIVLVLAGNRDVFKYNEKQRNFNIYDMISEADALFEKLSIENIKKNHYYAQNSRVNYAIDYLVDKNIICNIISFSAKFLNSIEISRPVILCKLDISALKTALKNKVLFKQFSNFPPVHRDLSIIADKSIVQDEIFNTIKSADNAGLLNKVLLYDVYISNDFPDKISYTYSLEYRALDRTLTSEEVNKSQEKIIKELDKKHNIKLRM